MENMKIYTLEEIADFLNVTVRTLYTYIKNGRLKANKIGGKWIVTDNQLREFIEGTGDKKD